MKIDPGDLFENVLPEILAKRPDLAPKEEVVKFRITGPGGGTWVIDFSVKPPAVRAKDEDAHCVISGSMDDFAEIVSGKVSLEQAYLAGKLRASGYLDVLFKISKLLSIAHQAT
jgi:hypothetical protein